MEVCELWRASDRASRLFEQERERMENTMNAVRFVSPSLCTMAKMTFLWNSQVFSRFASIDLTKVALALDSLTTDNNNSSSIMHLDIHLRIKMQKKNGRRRTNQIHIPYAVRTHFMLLLWAAAKHSSLECQLVFFSLSCCSLQWENYVSFSHFMFLQQMWF